uniref:Tetratricopeptide repeat-containing protein n=1 Tax=Candidatus Kentrum sp. TUN TaxID=2126343 RepID=A0A450ZWI3_9GAMM|nr:MAG: Tetratricopeptide repeat-containing protein [Candidatus Kentron sp. TUN]VFK58106.1 MAG: Tetratricopeptide repeat-containing protein [Candidatus Kentron sp. TUN]
MPKTVFISYRRDAIGKLFARSIERELTHRGYDVFLDVDTMEPGVWVEQIEREIPARAHFLLLLTPGALDPCADEGDWVRREYQFATRHGRNIVPVRSEDFDTDRERAQCPEPMRGVFALQIATVSHTTFRHDIAELIGRYLPPHKSLHTFQSEAAPSAPITRHNLPRRNPRFTGREALLAELHQQLTTDLIAGLRGLGGIGKTQTALEYAWRHHQEYDFIGWLRAEDPSALVEEFAGLSPLLGLETAGITDRKLVIGMVRRGIEERGTGLLVFDNVEARKDIDPYLPSPRWPGHILITARDPAAAPVRTALAPEEFTIEETGELLAGHLDPGNPQSLAELRNELGGLPLALEQARAYMAESGRDITGYLELFRSHRARLLEYAAAGAQADVTVATTWELAFQRVAEKMPEAAALFNLCAFLAPEGIPRRLFTEGAEHLPEELAARVTDPFEFDRLITLLRRHALIETDGAMFSLHRLVWAVFYERLPEAERGDSLARVIRLLNAAFPFKHRELDTWAPSAQLIAHVDAVWVEADKCSIISEELGHLLNQAGVYLLTQAEYPRSRVLLETALEIQQQLHGEQHPTTATTLNNLAGLLDSQGKYEEAKPLYGQALTIRRSVLGEDHPHTATSLNNLASLLKSQGKYQEAKPRYERALTILRSVLGEKHPDTANSLNNLAELLRAQGKYEEAKPLYEQALTICRSVFGEEHPDTANSLNNLAGLLYTQGKYGEAKPLYERALWICQSVFGEENPHTATSLNNLAGLLYTQGKYGEAKPLYERALGICQSVFGEEHPHTAGSLNNLAGLLYTQKKYAEAKPLYERALKIFESVLGEGHPDTAKALTNLGLLLFWQGDKQAAISHLARALAIRESVFGGTGHPSILMSLFNLGSVYAETGDTVKARQLLTRARALRQEHPEYPGTSMEKINAGLGKILHDEEKKRRDKEKKKKAREARKLNRKKGKKN